ncbi:hypothetical protein GCM10011607_42240 [Shewanella inventionis]|uniref:Uncharacterized protein n=1 Tax=Shewanella inventionis TaxID=1738770 RepID=A0ABQ1JWR1_9GAMM|nr:hypothetical protein GCM10011607_42240 [Shewanella inventionis]
MGGRALSIHSRQAVPDVLELLRLFPDHGVPVLHWFTGTASELKTAIGQGCWFSIGPAAFSSSAGKALARKLPRDRVLPESDGPFAQLDGRSVMPWDFDITVALLSDVWSLPFEEVRAQLLSNARMFVNKIGYTKLIKKLI